MNIENTEMSQSCKNAVSGSLFIERGTTSFCDGHSTRYWNITFKDLSKKVFHYIETFDNDLMSNKKYHCYIDYSGCIGHQTLETDSFKEAVNWMLERLLNYR
jgi:hypothetical protein